MYHAEKTHEAIIDIALFNRVQEIIAERTARFAPPKLDAKPVYPFSSLITCAKCGSHFRRKTTATGPVWICTTFNNIGKNACASKQIPETTLEKLTENIDMSTVTGITADDGNRFIFHFKDGGFVEKRWRDRSRSESWTDEMRQRAAEQTKARYQICRKEM